MMAEPPIFPERPPVKGVDVDAATRCAHYHSALDLVAIRVRCCGEYYACNECHDALADHRLQPWPVDDFDTIAVLCGACGARMSIAAYMRSGHHCPTCNTAFNPRCSLHYHFYFAEAG